MLTRIGVQRRVRWMLIVLIAVAFVSAIELPHEWFWLRLSSAGFAQIMIVWISGGWLLFERRRIKQLIHTASESVGLRTISPQAHKETS